MMASFIGVRLMSPFINQSLVNHNVDGFSDLRPILVAHELSSVWFCTS